MGIESDYIWFDGDLVPFADARVHVLSHTLHYGLGAFEGIRSYAQPDGRPGIWRLDDHMERLFLSLKMLRMKPAFSRDVVAEACLTVLEANGFTDAYIRPIVFFGSGRMGLGARDNPVHTAVAAWKWGAYLGEEGLTHGVRVKCSTFTRYHPNSAMQRAKVVGHYVNSVLARYEAMDDGYDEAVMLDQHGFVAEGTGENVFIAKGNQIKTPPVTNILPGVTRRTLIDLLEGHGYEVEETFFARDALYVADEVWMCGTAAEVTPIREIDRRMVGDGRPGPITKLLQAEYAAAVTGKNPDLRHLITTRD